MRIRSTLKSVAISLALAAPLGAATAVVANGQITTRPRATGPARLPLAGPTTAPPTTAAPTRQTAPPPNSTYAPRPQVTTAGLTIVGTYWVPTRPPAITSSALAVAGLYFNGPLAAQSPGIQVVGTYPPKAPLTAPPSARSTP